MSGLVLLITDKRRSRDYFATVGATLVDGRDFSADDRPDSPLVAIINEHFARAYW